MTIRTLEQKFVHDLADIYDAEHRFLEAQGRLLQEAYAPQLKALIQDHMAQTEQQIGNIEQIYRQLGASPQRTTCAAAAGLVSEGEQGLADSAGSPTVRDCVIGSALSKVEHYEVAAYRGLLTAAECMGQLQIATLLRQNLEQEEQTATLVEQSTPMLLEQAMLAQQRGV
jgi:ferritin-like metal-binding protein YciE